MDEAMLIDLTHNVAMLLALVVVFDTMGLRFRKGLILLHRLTLGLVIGAIGIGVMSTPMTVVPGVVFDTRSVLLGISGLFFGSFPTVIAMAVTAAYRLLQGGGGALTGIIVIVASGSLGILWRHARKHPMETTRWYEFYLFGVLSHLVMLALMLTMPSAVRGTVLSAISLPGLALFPLASLVLGLLLSKRVQREHTVIALRKSEEELRQTAGMLSRNEILLSKSQEIARIGTWELDVQNGQLTWTDEVYRIFGLKPQEFPATYDAFLGRVHPDDRDILDAEYSGSLLEGKDGYELEHRIVRKDDGAVRYVHEKCIHTRDDNGIITRSVGMVQDVTERQHAEQKLREAETESRRLLADAERSRMALLSVVEDMKETETKIGALLDEKELLLKETHHRIKNNIGTINSLLSLQANAQIDPAVKAVLDDAAQRLQSMMVLYDKLYRSENYGEMSVKEYLPTLIDEMVGAFPIAVPVGTDIRVDDFTLSAKILSNIGIIMNEFVANSMKYAFGGAERGLIHVFATVEGSNLRFVYGDDGAGLPETIDFEHSTGFGLQLVNVLVRQIGGSIRIDREYGTEYTIELEL